MPLIKKMLMGECGPVKRWSASPTSHPHIWPMGSVNAGFLMAGLREGGASIVDALRLSACPSRAYSIEYAVGSQLSTAHYARMGYGAQIELRPMERPIDDDAIAYLEAMRPDRRPSRALMRALRDGTASVPYLTMFPIIARPITGQSDNPALRRVIIAAQIRAAQGDEHLIAQIQGWTEEE